MIRTLYSYIAIPTSALMLVLAAPASWDVRAQQKGVLDLTVKSCADFSTTESHLDAAFHTVVKGYKSVPGQKEPVGELEGVETPEKVQEFMSWYANGGLEEIFLTGEMCRTEILMKTGEIEALRAGFFIAEERARNAEYFADKLLIRYTGKSLYRK